MCNLRLFLCVCLIVAAALSQTVSLAQSPSPAVQPPAAASNPASPPGAAQTEPSPAISPQGFFGEPDVDLANAVELENANSVQIESPDNSRIKATGDVRVRYKGYELKSDSLDLDLDKGTADFQGHLLLTGPNSQTVQGGPNSILHLDLNHDTYTISGAHATISAAALNGEVNAGILLPLLISGGTVSGQPDKIEAFGSEYTTCDFVLPHYAFQAAQMYIIPGKRLVAKHVSLLRKGHRIVTYPYVFVPLDRRFERQTFFPQVGDSADEGYFAKFALGYLLANNLPGILHLDLMQKKGVGVGFEQDYGSAANPKRGSGVISLYRLDDQNTGLTDFTGNWRHLQQLGTVQLNLNSQFEQNSYYLGVGASSDTNTEVDLSRSVGNLTDSLRSNLTETNFGNGNSETITSSFNQAFRPTDKEQLSTEIDYSQYVTPSFGGASGSDNREINTNFDYKQKGSLFDLEVLTSTFNQLGAGTVGNGLTGSAQRLPEFRLTTTPQQAPALLAVLPRTSQIELSLGDFEEPASGMRTERLLFDTNLGTNTRQLGGGQSVQYLGSFTQAFYGDDTAQYVLNGQTTYRLRIGRKSSVSATYAYLRPYGYSPFLFDAIGRNNLASFAFNYQETRTLQLSIAGGYDFNQTQSEFGLPATPWQNVALQSLYTPAKAIRLRTSATYDVNRGLLQDFTNTLSVTGSNATAVDLGARFDPEEHKFSNINGDLNLPFFYDKTEDAGWRIRLLAGYDGYTNQLDYSGLELTRSWHDWEASVIYQNDGAGYSPGSTITLNFRLKAFPAYEPFGIGQFGQPLDTGLGAVY